MRKVFIVFLFSCCGFCEFTLPESGARPQGLGNAFIGLSDNIYAIITNPAGLSLITSYETSFSYTTDNATKYDFLGITLPKKMKGNCGIAVLSKEDKAIYFSYGRDIVIKNKALSGGASIKLFKSDDTKGLGIDLGILYPVRQNLTFGFVLGNFLRDDFGQGFGLNFKIKDLLFTADIKERKRGSLHFGCEKKMKAFFVRGGMDDKKLSLGFSRSFSGIDMDFSISPLIFSFSFGYE